MKESDGYVEQRDKRLYLGVSFFKNERIGKG
jgi:hypothetical protein